MALTQQVQEHCTTVLCVGVGCKVDLLLPKLLQQLRASAWQLNANTLNTVAQLWGHCLNDGNGAILVEVHLL
jgi:hypothetical protein